MRINQFPEKLAASDTDNLLVEDVAGITNRISRKKFLPEAVGSGSVNFDTYVTTDFTATTQRNFLINPAADLTITLPANPTALDTFRFLLIKSSYKVSIELSGKKFNSVATTSTLNLRLDTQEQIKTLVFINDTIGYTSETGIAQKVLLADGYKLWLQDGSLIDKSGFGNNATNTGSVAVTTSTGTSGKVGFKWSGAGNQQLTVPGFLTGTTGSTLYAVYQVDVANNYNLARTSYTDDYWYFSGDGNGYLGTFQNSRNAAYPLTMPSSGLHLVSIHANNTPFLEVTVDSISKGTKTNLTYTPGTALIISPTDRAFNGILYAMIVYPSYIARTSADHTKNLQYFKNIYPLLPYTV